MALMSSLIVTPPPGWRPPGAHCGRRAAHGRCRPRRLGVTRSWYNRRMPRLGTKLMLAVLTGGLVVVAAEGVVSLATNRSLARRVRDGHAGLDRLPESPRALTAGDEDRRKAALANPGLYRVHRDPLVGYVLKTNAQQQILDGQTRSDHLGLRCRPAGDIPDGAVRLVVLGDSVAFGYGLNDEQTLAQQLE